MRLSEDKKKRISEQILNLLYVNFPDPLFTVKISQEIIRDEEFTKNLLLYLEKKNLLKKIQENPQGIKYKKRIRWTITNKVYKFYKESYKSQ